MEGAESLGRITRACVCARVSQGRLFGFNCWKKVRRKSFLHSSHGRNIRHLMSVVMVMKENTSQNKACENMHAGGRNGEPSCEGAAQNSACARSNPRSCPILEKDTRKQPFLPFFLMTHAEQMRRGPFGKIGEKNA